MPVAGLRDMNRSEKIVRRTVLLFASFGWEKFWLFLLCSFILSFLCFSFYSLHFSYSLFLNFNSLIRNYF